jgi:acyl carrier protein
MTTLESLAELLAEEYGIDRARLTPDTPLASLGIDSLGLVELLFLVEDRLGIEIPSDAPTELGTVAEVTAYVDGLRASGRGRSPPGPRLDRRPDPAPGGR